ncbi:hypothetical protein [Klebsiella phage PhiKpNIH-6]|jgi:hypothetical protein|uniref:Uncharacterized protein n=2 Tax=Marfavirus F48 TaxID=2845079 RepID=A0A5P8PJY4_9CAUD|nr:hypothetical protein CPTPhageEI1_025 [Klebsiella phage EI]QFR57051.1 hypothetical protein AmPhEK29_00114 [Klebsiella phage AmPh_EK29]QHB49372.1 hypothetical protein [Klebsiella phage PhiKpNIH-6]UEP19326.1 hypothetical protein [Klebsiella phage vB_KpnM-VAC36]WLJ70116.1 hypothetical protein BM7_CDS0187 [Klebsiella phage Kpn BM7]
MAARISKRRLKIKRKQKERALVKVLQEEITREIDREILKALDPLNEVFRIAVDEANEELLKELVKMSYKYS